LILTTAKFHSHYVKESDSGVGVGNSGKVGVGVGYFTSDSATLLANPPKMLHDPRLKTTALNYALGHAPKMH